MGDLWLPLWPKFKNVSKKAWLALCIAILLPIVGYLIADTYRKENFHMPRRYYYDTVVTKVKNGKETIDTVWHKVRNITLTNQLGQQVSLDDLGGKVLVVDFFFTRCPSICPGLTRNMKKLQDALKINERRKLTDTPFVHYLSFSVDPERDSVAALKHYADRFGVNSDLWWMLTGDKKSIYNFGFKELKLGLQDGHGIDTAFLHTDFFVLLDRDRVVRGYYSGLDTNDIARMAEDVVFLMLEKDKKKKRKLF